MPDTITFAGKKFPKKGAYVAIGGVVVVGGFVYYRRQQSAAAASTDTTATDVSTADQSNIDPATGFPYGSAEDSAALANFSVGPGLPVNTAGGGGTGGDIGPGSFTNNAQWAQAFESQVGSTGNDSVAAALGKYLTAAPVDASQVQIIQEAIASQGFPPVAGASGFPPSYHTKAAPSPHQPPPPKGKKTHEVIANGHQTLRDMATASGTTTYAQAQKLNPWAHRFTVKTKNIPHGYHVKLYSK